MNTFEISSQVIQIPNWGDIQLRNMYIGIPKLHVQLQIMSTPILEEDIMLKEVQTDSHRLFKLENLEATISPQDMQRTFQTRWKAYMAFYVQDGDRDLIFRPFTYGMESYQSSKREKKGSPLDKYVGGNNTVEFSMRLLAKLGLVLLILFHFSFCIFSFIFLSLHFMLLLPQFLVNSGFMRELKCVYEYR